MNPERTTPAAIEAHYLPLIAAARTAAEERRDEAWLDVPHEICGLPTRAMTLSDYLALHAAGNAYLTAVDEPDLPAARRNFWALHSGILLWRLSPEYRPCAKARDTFIKKRLVGRDIPTVRLGVEAFIREMFADRVRPVKVEARADHAPLTVPASFAACWIHDLATAYGWTDAHILALSLPRIFQLRQLLLIESRLKNGGKVLPSGDEADRLAAAAFSEIAALGEPV